MDKLNILWTTTNKDTVINMISMYSINALKKGWWKEVNIIIWGGSTKLVGEDTQIQAEVKKMKEAGIMIEACRACADKHSVTEVLENIGIDVKFMGEPLTKYLKQGEKILTL